MKVVFKQAAHVLARYTQLRCGCGSMEQRLHEQPGAKTKCNHKGGKTLPLMTLISLINADRMQGGRLLLRSDRRSLQQALQLTGITSQQFKELFWSERRNHTVVGIGRLRLEKGNQPDQYGNQRGHSRHILRNHKDFCSKSGYKHHAYEHTERRN